MSNVDIAHTNAAGKTKIQKKAYGRDTQSRQTDGLFKEDKFMTRTQLLNHSRVDYNIIRPAESKQASMPHCDQASKVLKTIRDGNCHQVYGICEFI